MSMAGGQRPPLTSFGMSNVAPVVPKGRVVSAGNPKGKGKSSFGGNGSMSEEQSSLAESEMVSGLCFFLRQQQQEGGTFGADRYLDGSIGESYD